MKVRRNRFSPKSTGGAQGCSPLAERLARHLRWSAAISGAFLRADGPPRWRSTTFTFGLGAKRMFSLVRRVLNFRLSWSPLKQTVAITNNFLKQQVSAAGDGRSPAGRGAGCRIPAPQATPLAFRHSHLLHTFSHVEKLSQPRIWLQPPAGSMPPSGMLPAKTISRAMRRDGVRQGSSAQEMTTRIMRGLRRVEEGPLSPEPRLAFGASTVHGFGGKLETPGRRQHRDLSVMHSSENAASIPIPAAVNVTQLTDEVMRQLDRRLVAVRERMGKI